MISKSIAKEGFNMNNLPAIGLSVLCVLVALVIPLLLLGRKKVRQQQAEAARMRTAATPEDPLEQPIVDAADPRRIKVGDTVKILGITYIARGTVKYTDGSYAWLEHLLDDGSDTRVYLQVEENPDLQVTLYTEIPGANLKPANVLAVGGATYHLVEKGDAAYSSTGTTGIGQKTGTAKYHDYNGSENKLSLESFNDGGWEASIGTAVPLGALTIYPAQR